MRSDLNTAAAFLRRLTAGVPAEERRFLCAVSGGLDSMCLLAFVSDWCAQNGGTVCAAHFNHRIRAAADRDEAFVRDFCAKQSIPFCRGEGDCPALAEREKRTLEEAARCLRYNFLTRAAEAQHCRWILTAHHADDNAETVLLNLIRGAGSRGLRGIPAVRGNIARPFLEIPKSTLEQYAVQHWLPHVEDETNASDTPARNRLRHQVLPVLRTLNPRAAEHITRTAERLGQEEEALSWAAEPFLRAAEHLPDGGVQIRCADLSGVPEAVTVRVLQGLLPQTKEVSARHLAAMQHLLRQKTGSLTLPHQMQVCVSGGILTVSRRPAVSGEVFLRWEEPVSFGDGWRVTLSRTPGQTAHTWALSLPPDAAVSVSAWRPSDRLALPGSRGARSLKRLCADKGLSLQQRDALPVLRVQGTAAVVPGVGADARFLTNPADADGWITILPNSIKNRGGNNNEQ